MCHGCLCQTLRDESISPHFNFAICIISWQKLLQKQAVYRLRYLMVLSLPFVPNILFSFDQFIYQLGELEVWRSTIVHLVSTDTNIHLRCIKWTVRECNIQYGHSAQPGHIVSRRLILPRWECNMHFTWFSKRYGVFSLELTASSPNPDFVWVRADLCLLENYVKYISPMLRQNVTNNNT